MPPKRSNPNKRLFFELIKRLTKTESDDAAFASYLRYAALLKHETSSEVVEYSESFLAEKIKKALQLSNNSHLISRFEELHRRLQCGDFLKKREAVLIFLLSLSSASNLPSSELPVFNIANLPHNVTLRQPNTSCPDINTIVLATPSVSQSTATVKSWRNAASERKALKQPNSSCPDINTMLLSTPVSQSTETVLDSWRNTASEKILHPSDNILPPRILSTYSKISSTNFHDPLHSNRLPAYGDTKREELNLRTHTDHGSLSIRYPGSDCLPVSEGSKINGSPEEFGGTFPVSAFKNRASERVVLQDLLFSFQGVPGTLLRLDHVTLGFKFDSQFCIARPLRRVVERLSELGWLHNQLRRFCEEAESSRSVGLLEKSLVSALREELTEYYRLVAVLQTQAQEQQLEQSADSPLNDTPLDRGLTLRNLSVWAMEPTERLRCLVAMAETCRGRKGGALASAVYSFLQYGDPVTRQTARHLLAAVCKPLYIMLSRWVVDGELEDPYGEFFIAADPQVTGERLWYDKYRVQNDLVPQFIPIAEADKILATGKSINFLQEICQDTTPVHGRDMLRQALESASVEALFTPSKDGDLWQVMEMAYREVSQRVLDVLSGPHKFLENLHAIRRYLLLGQGDFIRHLMEIISPELCKPATHLYGHNLSGILEAAIRATNAQFEDPEILNRLDVRLLEVNAGDIGWDVFTLDYQFSGPISTIFVPNSSNYLMLFSSLWRAKRSEYVLTGSWKRQTTTMRLLRSLPELAPILQRTHLLTAEMIHLVQQMQYYTLFEVLECSWHEMVGKLGRAKSLDDIIEAHKSFVEKAKAGALQDDESKRLAARLRVVHSLVLNLERIETELHSRALQELDARNAHEQKIEARGACGQFGINTTEEQIYEKARADFKKKYVRDALTKLTVLATDYQEQVKNFLLELADHPNNNLQLLSFRIDFNDHYKRREPRLVAPYTYQHRRLSELGQQRASLSGVPPVKWATSQVMK